MIKIIAKDKENTQQLPAEARKYVLRIHKNLEEMEHKYLMGWPGIGPALQGEPVKKDILTSIALDKAKASLTKRE